ncbi:uncharacterized protein C19orf57 homolog isoform X4 [Zalophus californianus]|uniref:Uncharacterized protein C19orf57 homolog isoform X4 n=1 Tax=Zalophus californianus TaxID=9704 RepID=A0A6J2C2H2_ZALCA|nr:uncharacterized protein C19orf57 homolog isoform X4 [Zalophus californianus]
MSKRKKLRTSGGEGVRPMKAPKNPRLGDSDAPPQNSEWGSLCLREESEGRLEPMPSAERRTEEPVQTVSSSHDEEAGAPLRLLGQPEEEPVPALFSQNSARRFVPPFAKPRKTVTRQTELREEDLGGGAPKISQETPPEPSAQQARSQLWEESLGLAPWEARELGAQTQVDSTHPEYGDQNPMTHVPGNGNPQPSASIDASPEWGTVPLASETASQDHLSEQGTNTPDGESREGCWVLGYHGQKGLLLSSDAEEESDQGALQETDQAVLGESPAMEPDFLPDSQIRDALEAPDFEASPAQLFPMGTRLRSWPGTSPHADGGLLTELQLRTCVGIKACEAARMEDATDTVRGLVVELSNLNRLIMSAHRDLEAFKRLSYRKARLAGKAPAPYTSKRAGNLPPGRGSWRDL